MGSADNLDRERPMSWEGELSDQEASQMDQESVMAHHHTAASASQHLHPPPEVEASQLHHSSAEERGDRDSEAAAAALTLRHLKTEPVHQSEEPEEEELLDEEDEHEMEGIQSVGPGSPQPMCTNTAEGLEAEEHPNDADVKQSQPHHFAMPPPALVHSHSSATPVITDNIKTESPWSAESPKADASLSGSGSVHPHLPSLTPSAAGGNNTNSGASSVMTPNSSGINAGLPPQRPPAFGEAFTGHTPLASPLTSRHPIRLPLVAAASGKQEIKFILLLLSLFFSNYKFIDDC